MLNQLNQWADYAGMVFDLILMLRILTLKLRQTYVFISLYVLMDLFYDGVELWLGSQSNEFHRVSFFSKFIFAILYPLAVWDSFEEAKGMVDQIRKLAMSRMMTSLLFISLWGLLISAFTGSEGEDQAQYLIRLAVIVWTGSIASALAFLWVMRRGIQGNNWELPRNTTIWVRYFQVSLVIEAIACLLLLGFQFVDEGGRKLAETVGDISYIVLQAGMIILTCWCVYKLRAVPSDATNVPVNVKG